MFFLFTDFLPAQEVDTLEKTVHRTFEDRELMWGPCPEFFPEGCSIAVLHGDPTKEIAEHIF